MGNLMKGTIHDYRRQLVVEYYSDFEFRRKALTAKTDSGTRFQFGTPFKYISIFNMGSENVYARFGAAGTVSAACGKIIGGAALQEPLMGSVVHLYARGTPEIQVHVKR